MSGKVEYLVYGRKPGDPEYMEMLLKTGLSTPTDAQAWKARAEQDGFVAVRIAKFVPGTLPDFVSTINR